MKATLLLISVAALIAVAAPKDSPQVVICLKGLDAVELAQGREIQGTENLSVVRGKFRYLFANNENKARFETNPERYAIQMGGACGRMGPLSGLGDPDRFFVHDGRIYIFASENCRDGFKSAPENHIDQADAPPDVPTSNEDKKLAPQLINRALEGFGGAAKVDAVTSLQTTIKKTYKHNNGTADYVTATKVAFPDKYRSESSWLDWQGADVVNAMQGFRSENKESWAMEDSEREYMIRQFNRHPPVILKARNEQGFRAVAAGRGKIGETEVEWLKVGIQGATSTLGLDPQTGRILSVAYRGRVGGPIGDLVKTFSNFRQVDGLMLPFTTEVSFNGEPKSSLTSTYDSIIVNGKIDAADFASRN